MGDEKNLGMSQKVISPSRSTSSCSSKLESRQDSWEIVEGLRGSMSVSQEPQTQEGFLLKKRKWPLKGWHKRYFFLDKGVLKYAKGQGDIDKGKLHGCIDVGLSVMSIKKSTKCIDLDTEEHIYHLKMKSQEVFDEWVSKLRDHRLYRQNEISMYSHDMDNPFFPASADTSPTGFDASSVRKASIFAKQNSIQTGNCAPFLCTNSDNRVPVWLKSSEDLEKCSKDLSQCHAYLLEMSTLLQNMEVLHRTYSAPAINAFQSGPYESPKKEKPVHRKRWRTKGIGKDAKGTLQVPSLAGQTRLHASNPNLSTIDYAEEKPYSDGSESSSDFSKMQEELCRIAHKVYFTLKSSFNTVLSEREKLKQVLEHDSCSSPSAQIVGLKNTLASAIAQNSELKDRLRRIHAESLLLDSTAIAKSSPGSLKERLNEGSRPLIHQLSNESRLSIAESVTEFFDAQEVLLSASSSENEISEDDSYASDASDNISEDNLSNDVELDSHRSPLDCERDNNVPFHSSRRISLPAPCPNTSNISLWNIMRNNIGKDLSKVSMPVQLNEPLNTLQRLCEELEYSELLDKAAETQDPFERMVYVATFAVSAYASSFYRAGSKPFNPMLGETYEYHKEEKGVRFLAEQVSHHPPISACHAESEKFVFWQDVRWKNKFWGKSMEIVPIGTTHVTIPAFEDHYEWNKVTSCIHNILSGQRWIEHYGEILITNTNDDSCHCKLTFTKAKYWNPNVHEIEGAVLDKNGKAVHRLFGKWHESLFCGTQSSSECIWRANPMPKDYEKYYGFTRYALELNEIDPQIKHLLPRTDTRFRPDQRFLEEGDVEGAEMEKQRIEQQQRERRKLLEENNVEHQARFFRKSTDESWVSNETYWELRKEPGFSKLDNITLW